MPVKRKLNKNKTKVPRNVKINSKSSKRASQKKRGRSGRGRKSQRGGDCKKWTPQELDKIFSKDNIVRINGLAQNFVTKKLKIIRGKKKKNTVLGKRGDDFRNITLETQIALDDIFKSINLEEGFKLPLQDEKKKIWMEMYNVEGAPHLQTPVNYIDRKLWTYDSSKGDFHTFLFRTKESPNQKLRCFFQ